MLQCVKTYPQVLETWPPSYSYHNQSLEMITELKFKKEYIWCLHQKSNENSFNDIASELLEAKKVKLNKDEISEYGWSYRVAICSDDTQDILMNVCSMRCFKLVSRTTTYILMNAYSMDIAICSVEVLRCIIIMKIIIEMLDVLDQLKENVAV